MTENLINRARAALNYMEPADVMRYLVDNGETREHAFLAVKAAMIIDRK